MTTPFSAQIKAIQDFRARQDEIILEQVRLFEAEIIDYVTEEQLFEGKRSDGTDIEPEYTPFTTKIKLGKGQPVDRVTLKDTGRFYDSIRIEYFNKFFSIVADDSKIAGLERKYGTTILGLSAQGVQDLIDMIRGPFIEEFRLKLAA